MNDPRMTAPLLDVRDLRVIFRQGGRETVAVGGVSFHLDPGETLALVGESGSGKSVTALSLVRLAQGVAETGGDILFEGKNLTQADEATLRGVRGDDITIVFQEPMTSLNPLHSIEKQVGEIIQLHQTTDKAKVRARVLELLTEVGLPDPETRLNAYPHQLSGGQRQRVMIAMSLANRPKLLIADEPTTALDVTVQAQILKLLKELQQKHGMAMLFITHDLGVVRRIADRVAVMQKGKIVETGPTERVFTQPEHPYTRMLLAAEPKGAPAPSDRNAKTIVQTDDLKVWFPIKRGFLRKTVGHVKAVDGISVTVREGQTVGVVGESGSGKTTLGLAILRLIRSEGPILYLGERLDGLDSAAMRPKRRDMQMVFQDPYGSLSPRMSVAEIVAEGLEIQRPALSEAERRDIVAKALVDVGLDPSAMDRYPHEFSGGQRQRIAIARARHRPRHGAGAEIRRARRADLGARHVGAGADRRSVA